MADDRIDSTIEGTGESKRRSLDPSFKRNIMIIGGFMAVCVALVLFFMLRGGSKTGPQQPDSQLTLGTGQTQRVESITPEMAAKLERKQTEESQEARRMGQTYIPPDNVGAVQPVSMQPAPIQQNPAGPSSLAVGTAPVTVNGNGNGESDLRRREGMMRQLETLLRDAPQNSTVRQRIVAEASGGGQQASTRGPVGSAVAGAAAAPATSGGRREVVGALTIHAAELTSDIKIPSNATGFATGRITAGPATGAFLTGSARVVDESLEITFTQMRLNGKVYPVNARVLDEATAGAAIEGNVDRRLLQRYAFPVVLAAAQGFFTAMAQTGNTLVSIGGGASTTAGISTPPPSTEEARSAGIAAGLQIGGQEVQKAAQQPIVVSRGRGFPVGLLFSAAVLEEQP